MTLRHQLDLPAVFGRYLLLQRLNRGGMGEIFLAKLGEIQGFEKPIVIKKILPDLAQDAEFLQRFTAEAQIAIKLTHGNIVPVYEVGRIHGEYFLALQYVEGRDLRSLLMRCRERRQRIPPDICLFVARELANGLAYAHRRTDETGRPLALVHCDISPPNILLSWEGEVKIIDFGIAKSAMQTVQTNTGVGFGKFGYMAPEQLIRGGGIDRRTDIYSTGVLLYEMLTGERLFNFSPGIDFRRVAKEVTAGGFAPPSERDLSLGPHYDNLVMRALRTNKEERYASAEELRDEIQQHLYAMNPTISADALAAFMREQFKDAIEADRQMLLALSQTDIGPYREELSDASSHTVSYALAGLWSDRPRVERVEEGGGAAEEAEGVEEKEEDRPTVVAPRPTRPPEGSFPSTSRSRGSVTAPGVSRSLGSATASIIHPHRTLVLLGLTLGGLLGVGTALGLLLRQGPAALQLPRAPLAAGQASGDSAAPPPQAPDSGARMTFPPEVVASVDAASPGRVAPAHAPRVPQRAHAKAARPRGAHRPWRTKVVIKAPSAPRDPSPPREISLDQVKRRFQEVQREYEEFKRSQGHVLEGEWQKVLFAVRDATAYGDKDQQKYERLARMLSDLQRQMKARSQ